MSQVDMRDILNVEQGTSVLIIRPLAYGGGDSAHPEW